MDSSVRREFLRCLSHDFWAIKNAPICAYKPAEIDALLVSLPYATFKRKRHE